MPTSTKVLAFLTLIVYIAHLVFNSLAGIGGSRFFPDSVAKVSENFHLLITPVPRTFAIWGIIFTLQLCWSIYGVATVFITSPTANILSDAFYVSFMINNVFITIWLLTWARNQAVYSLIVIVAGQFAVAVSIGLAMYDLKKFLDRNMIYCQGNSDIWTQRIIVQNGLLFYGTWTMIATLLNFAVVLVYYVKLSQKVSSLITLSILGILTVVWFVLESTVLSQYAAYSFSVYTVLMIGLCGIICSTDKLLRRLTSLLLFLSTAFFVVRLIIIGVHNSCPVTKPTVNNTIYNNTAA